MYDRDIQGHPIRGAPISHFISLEYQRVCSLCKALHDNSGFGNYWRELHRVWKTAQEERRKKNDGLSGKKDYFTGA